MHKKWNVLFCDPYLKPCPVEDFIDACRIEHQVKILHFVELLEEMGPTLPRPYADLLEDGIHELRISLSGDHLRMLYFFCFESYIIVYRAFRKHTSRVPDEYIRETRRYRDSFLGRMDRDALEKIADAEPSCLKSKCADARFDERYRDECNICPKTVTIIDTIGKKGLTKAEAAQGSGVAPERIELLGSADRCEFDEARKLARFLGLSFTGQCRKTKQLWTD